eukprot:c28742_g1_i2 orf=634-2244(+)
MAASSTQTPGVKAHFKTPEGRCKLSYEKTHPTGLLHYGHSKAPTQVTLAYLKEKLAPVTSTFTNSIASSSVKLVTQRLLLGTGNGARALGFGGSNGSTRFSGSSKFASVSNTNLGMSNGPSVSNYDGEGTYLIFNVGDALFVSDYNSHDKDPIKAIQFNNAYPVCHAFDPEAKDGHDLLIGLNSGDVYSVSLRQQLQDPAKKLIGAMHYNKDGSVNNSRCTAVAWVPLGDGYFIVAHADGNLYMYDKNKDGSGDASFPPVKDQTQFSVVHARSSKSNPIARWHVCQGSINGVAFSVDGVNLATVGRDGFLRIFDFKSEHLICGGKSYFGALLCCSWSPDGKYVLTGGEDDLVQVWSMEDRAVVAWGEGHNSWVSGVCFDPFGTTPSSDDTSETVTYRFGSVGQDTQLLLWDLSMDEVVMPLRRLGPSGGSPTFSSGSGHSSHWESGRPVGALQPSPLRQEVPKLAPVVAHRVHLEPLSGLIFTKESIVTFCHDGHIKVWVRPGHGDSHASNMESPIVSTKDKHLNSNKISTAHYKQ